MSYMLHREIAKLREENADLRAEIKALKGACEFYDWPWRLTAAQCRLLARLYRAKGQPVAFEALYMAMSQDAADLENPKSTLRAQVHKMRRHLPAEVEIVSHWRSGYSLSHASISFLATWTAQ